MHNSWPLWAISEIKLNNPIIITFSDKGRQYWQKLSFSSRLYDTWRISIRLKKQDVRNNPTQLKDSKSCGEVRQISFNLIILDDSSNTSEYTVALSVMIPTNNDMKRQNLTTLYTAFQPTWFSLLIRRSRFIQLCAKFVHFPHCSERLGHCAQFSGKRTCVFLPWLRIVGNVHNTWIHSARNNQKLKEK